MADNYIFYVSVCIIPSISDYISTSLTISCLIVIDMHRFTNYLILAFN